jgi:L-asparaginase/beta-aspartyl-peptidase (threonine type)
MLAGRVGDTPIPGSGFYAGSAAAVAATGIGEEIIRRMISIRVYDEINQGTSVEKSCRNAIERFPKEYSLGVISISREGFGAEHNRDMAWAKCVEETK